jgi:hypothetical protein
MTQCLASHGLSFNPGEERGFSFLEIGPNFGGVADQPAEIGLPDRILSPTPWESIPSRPGT